MRRSILNPLALVAVLVCAGGAPVARPAAEVCAEARAVLDELDPGAAFPVLMRDVRAGVDLVCRELAPGRDEPTDGAP